MPGDLSVDGVRRSCAGALTLVLGALVLGPARAAGPGGENAIDLTPFARRAEVPTACAAVPSPDTLMGSVGAAGCFVPRDAARPTAVQAANVATGADGTWSVTWARPFASAAPVVNPLPINAGSLPILCNVASRSGSGATGRCWQSTATTLPGTVAAVLGIVVSPFGTPAANAAVMVIAREPTQ